MRVRFLPGRSKIPDQSYALDTTWRTLLKDLGIPAADVLRQAGLPDDLLLSPTVRLSSAEYYRLWNAIECATTGMPLPIRVLDAIKAETFSPLLFAALCSPNLVTALQRVAKYKGLIGPMDLVITENQDRVTVAFRWLDTPHRPPDSLILMELLFVVALARMGTRHPIRPLAVTTSVCPTDAGAYEEFLRIPISPSGTHAVSFSGSDAIHPFVTGNDWLWDTYEPELRTRLSNLQELAGFSTRVRAVLNETIPSGTLDMETVARRLGLSKRTLQRNMAAEGTSFQAVVQDVREKLARHYLSKTKLPAAEISFLLGFDEPNSFYRAFRRWTGMTPESLRR